MESLMEDYTASLHKHNNLSTHALFRSFRPIVLKSIGILITFRYVGNCLELTGVRNGQASWCFFISVKIVLQ